MIPDYPRIYLQPNEAGIGRHTWCQDRIADTDIEYIRSDIAGGEGWQSIETAPKDTPILVGRGRVNLGDGTYKDGIVLEAQWDAHELGWYFGGYVGGWLKADPEHPPTHWQPLPEPPRAAIPTQESEDGR